MKISKRSVLHNVLHEGESFSSHLPRGPVAAVSHRFAELRDWEPSSAPPLGFFTLKNDSPRKYSGYTLIEILIVIFIVSIVTTVALLAIGRNENKRLESFANDLTQLISLAEEEAMLQPAVLGLIVNGQALQFVQLRTDEEKKKNSWVLTQNKILAKQNIPDGIQIDLNIGNDRIALSEDEIQTPQIIISTNGEITPFAIYVSQKNKKPRYVVRGEVDGSVENEALS